MGGRDLNHIAFNKSKVKSLQHNEQKSEFNIN